MVVDTIFSSYIQNRLKRIESFQSQPIESQNKVLSFLINQGKSTEFGKNFEFNTIKDYSSFQKRIPIHDYDGLAPYIEKSINGVPNILWPGTTKWFAKSSGTTGGRIKILPITQDLLYENHYAGGKDLLAMYHKNVPNRKLYSKKHLILGGSNAPEQQTNGVVVADLSAIIIDNLPYWTEFRRIPKKNTVLLSNWEEKLHRVAEESINDNIAIIAGVPSWITVLIKLVLEKSNKKSLIEVWPNLELYIHGGMNIGPYKQTIQELIGNPDMNFLESYNASEGYFGLQNNLEEDDLLLLTDSQIFYEFIPMSSFNGVESSEIIPLEEVKTNIEYAMVISTSAGLWRYIIGDTIQFTSIHPFKFKVVGRTTHYINAFGEKMVIIHAEKAIQTLREKHNLQIIDFTVAPYFSFENGIGGHEWAIETTDHQIAHQELEKDLDEIVRKINSDYDAKRFQALNILPLKINNVKKGTFACWLKNNGKLGGQHKIPRLQNDRDLLEKILSIHTDLCT